MDNHKKVGPIIAIFVIVVAIVILALYLFASSTNNQKAVQPVTNTNDDLQSIQNDLNNATAGVDNQNF